MDSNSGAFFHV
jgi:hypothetical protein